jgi:hypothetical protein
VFTLHIDKETARCRKYSVVRDCMLAGVVVHAAAHLPRQSHINDTEIVTCSPE